VTILRLVRDSIARYPSAFGLTLGAMDFYLSTAKEIVVVGSPEGDETKALTREIWSRYLPNKVVAQAAEGDEEAARISPLLRERPMREGRTTVYVCENRSCLEPVTTPQQLAAQLDVSRGKSTGSVS
jgi:uncharacterized protein YyaL (SSP411 family)